MDIRKQRLLGVGGLVFVAIVAASIFILPSPPDSHASPAKVVSYFNAHKTVAGVAGHLILLAVFLGTFVFWHFRDALATNPATRRLATIGFAGAVVFVVSGGIAAASYFAITDTLNHANPVTLQTLNILQNDVSDGVGEGGVALFLVASSIAVLRGANLLPRWIGWLGILLGVASLLVFGLGLPAMGLWLLISCITLLVRTPAPEPAEISPQPAFA